MACMVALDAFSIDAMLPALAQIAQDLDVAQDNHRQYIITSIFLGFLVGVFVFGFIADSFGRRNPAMLGFALHIIGSAVCMYSNSFAELLLGRVLQGMGAAGPYVLSTVIIRDQFEGRAMARILSLVMMVFICVPMVAPFIGQSVMHLAGWRSIFGALLIFSVIVLIWFACRQQETLKPSNRKAFSAAQVKLAVKAVFSNNQSFRYLVCLGVMLGAFITYLSTGQQIFQVIFQLGDLFPVVFASLAACFGVGSFVNSRSVVRLGSKRLIHYALTAIVLVSVIFLVEYYLANEGVPLWFYIVYLAVVVFSFAFLFSNFTALALEPLGEIAGAASSIINSSSTAIAIVIAALVGAQLNTTVLPVVFGFGGLGLFAWCLNYRALKG